MSLEDLVTDIHILLINEINDWTTMRSLNKYWNQLADNVERESNNPIMVTKKSVLSYLETQPENFSWFEANYDDIISHPVFYIKDTDFPIYKICDCLRSKCKNEYHHRIRLVSYKEKIKKSTYNSYGLLSYKENNINVTVDSYDYDSLSTIAGGQLYPGYELINHAVNLHPFSVNENFRNKRFRITIEKYFNLLQDTTCWKWLDLYNYLFMILLTNENYDYDRTKFPQISKEQLEFKIEDTLNMIYPVNNFKYSIK